MIITASLRSWLTVCVFARVKISATKLQEILKRPFSIFRPAWLLFCQTFVVEIRFFRGAKLAPGEQGWCSGESTRLSPMWPGFKSRRPCYMWLEFVVGSLSCSERFFSGYSGFPLSSKTNISKFQFDQESGRRRTIMWMCYLQIVIYFIYLPFS